MERIDGADSRNQKIISLANGGSLHVSIPDDLYLREADDAVGHSYRLSFKLLIPLGFIGDSEHFSFKNLSIFEQAPKEISTSEGPQSIIKYVRNNGELEIYLNPIAKISQDYIAGNIRDSKGKKFWWVSWVETVMKSKQANEYYQRPGTSKRNKSAELVEKLINDLILTQSAISHLNLNEQQFKRFISENEALIGLLSTAGFFLSIVAINNRIPVDAEILFLLGVAGISEISARKTIQFLQSLKVNRIKNRLESDLYSSGGPFVILFKVV